MMCALKANLSEIFLVSSNFTSRKTWLHIPVVEEDQLMVELFYSYSRNHIMVDISFPKILTLKSDVYVKWKENRSENRFDLLVK